MKRWFGAHEAHRASALGPVHRSGFGEESPAMPDVARDSRGRSPSDKKPDVAQSWLTVESFRTLRTNLMLTLPEGAKLLVVTSSRPKEGKSTVAANLAGSLAAVGKSVLLVDADLRRPRLHEFFGVDNNSGLGDVLSGSRTLDDVLETVAQGLFLVTSGPTHVDPQALFTSGHFEAFAHAARARFDFVIFDSAPFLAVADTSLIVPRVDGVIFVLRYGLVTESEAIRTKIRLDAAGTPIVGAVFNAFEAADPDYYHPYSSYYTRQDKA